MPRGLLSALLLSALALPLWAQNPQADTVPPARSPTADAPLPDPRTLLLDVERNDKRLEALRKDYTYHVHTEQQELDKHGSVKKQEITEAESLTLDGVRVDRIVARNGHLLTPDDQARENERIDKEVAKAKARQAKAAGKGEDTDDRGDTMLTAARILELGRFTNERRVLFNGRPTIVLDYAGDPNAKTHNQMESIVRDLVGTVWIDEKDRVLVRGEGHFLNDFKIAGGLLADVRKGSSFQFEATHVDGSVWLPASIAGQGSIRLLLFAGFNGWLRVQTSDYHQFRASATILPGERRVDDDGQPVTTPPAENPAEGVQPTDTKPQR